MKNVLLSILVFCMLIPFNACKKGDDDPFISLRSRNQRLIGKWKIIESHRTKERIEVYNYGLSGDTFTDKSNFKDNKGTFAQLFYHEWISHSYEGEAIIEFKSDGTLLYKERYIVSTYGEDLTTDGNWTWRQTAKSKYSLEITDIPGLGFGEIFEGGILNLQRLSHGEITLESTTKHIIIDPKNNGDGTKINKTVFYRLERVK
ncbi:MAG: hypothetical protein RLZZ110_212 [Bacteroidota bacterium]|jgi:hypothetical protein